MKNGMSVIRKIGKKSGIPRIWLEGEIPLKAGFLPGSKFEVKVYKKKIILVRKATGSRVVNKKKANGKFYPIVDIQLKAIKETFPRAKAVKVVFKKGQITFSSAAGL